MSAWIQTYHGKAVDILDPQPDQICIEDIAHSLARIARYNGHTKEIYTVAQHSVLVADYCNKHAGKNIAARGLMHDATEAYVGDLAKPIKDLDPIYKQIEKKFQEVIFTKYFGDSTYPPLVDYADRKLLITEVKYLMTPQVRSWQLDLTPIDDLEIIPWSPADAEVSFLLAAIQYGLCDE